MLKGSMINFSKITKEGKSIGKYLLIEKLGKGQFGVVWKGYDSEEHKVYAIKVIEKKLISSNKRFEDLLNSEVSILKQINHQNILHLYDFLESQNNYYLVL